MLVKPTQFGQAKVLVEKHMNNEYASTVLFSTLGSPLKNFLLQLDCNISLLYCVAVVTKTSEHV